MNDKVDILVFAAHPDDAELSCAGTIMKHIAQGKKVAIVDLTQGELGSRGTIETRYDEAKNASNILGISFRENLKMKDGWFEKNHENKIRIIEQIRRFQPQIVLANALTDRHPDHGRAGELVSEACFLSGLRKINTKWNGNIQEHHRPKAVYHYVQDYYVKPDFIVDVSTFVERKMEAIKCYKTQFFNADSKEPNTPISGEDYFDFLKGRMKEMGRPAGMKFAEGFTVERFIGVDDLTNLI